MLCCHHINITMQRIIEGEDVRTNKIIITTQKIKVQLQPEMKFQQLLIYNYDSMLYMA